MQTAGHTLIPALILLEERMLLVGFFVGLIVGFLIGSAWMWKMWDETLRKIEK